MKTKKEKQDMKATEQTAAPVSNAGGIFKRTIGEFQSLTRGNSHTQTQKETQTMNANNNQTTTAAAVSIPKEIRADNHRRAYAAAYRRAAAGVALDFIPAILRNSLVRGYLDGLKVRAEAFRRDFAAMAETAAVQG